MFRATNCPKALPTVAYSGARLVRTKMRTGGVKIGTTGGLFCGGMSVTNIMVATTFQPMSAQS
jgi:hypothetical protein